MDHLSIRTRLILAFLGVVLLSLSGVSLMLVIANTRAAQQENVRQLTTLAAYKGNSIREWTNSLTYELAAALVGENMIPSIQAVVEADSSLDARSLNAQRERLRTRLRTQVAQTRYFDEFLLLNPEGQVVIGSLAARDGQDYSSSDFFTGGRSEPYIGTPSYSRGQAQTLLYAAYPIYGEGRRLIGVLAGRAKTAPLEAVFADSTGFREPGTTYLAGEDGSLIAGPVIAWRGKIVLGLREAFNITGTPASQPLAAEYDNLNGEGVTAAYVSLPELRGVLVIEQTRRDLARSQQAALMVNLSVIISSVLLALYIALQATRSIAVPVSDLAEIATGIAATARGEDTDGTAMVEGGMPAAARLEAAGRELQALTGSRTDEIGILALAFHGMTGQLAGLIGSLENIVAERTRQLELRSSYLEASADIGRVTTSILDPEKLIGQAVELIRDRFELYYVGLFLADRENQWAVLRAGTGEAGQRMIHRGHRLRIEPTSMIGWCISNAQARIAQVASFDEVRAPNPDLPETRSEVALPLRSRGQVTGALSVQSTQPNAFDQTTLAVLQTMADQLATAIENAQLYAQSQEALEAERRAYSEAAQTEWHDWLSLRSGLSARSDLNGPVLAPAVWRPEMRQAIQANQPVISGEHLAIPIRVRGATIGVINTARPGPAGAGKDGRSWSSEEVSFLETIAEQLGVALDSARLYAETRQRAEQDRLVDEMTSRMRATLDLRSVLETAAREMRDALGLAEVEVRLGGPDTAQGSGAKKNE